MADLQITIINSSTDQNNSQFVIFQRNAADDELFATATHIISVPAGETVNVPIPGDGGVCLAALSPDVVAGQTINTKDLATPAVAIQPGQTAYITGTADAGYSISVKNPEIL